MYGKSCRACHVARDEGAANAYLTFDESSNFANTDYAVCGSPKLMPNAFVTYTGPARPTCGAGGSAPGNGAEPPISASPLPAEVMGIEAVVVEVRRPSTEGPEGLETTTG